MDKLLIIANEVETREKLIRNFSHNGYSCSTANLHNEMLGQIADESPSLVLVDIDGSLSGTVIWEFTDKIKQELHLPVIALINRDMLDNGYIHHDEIDDFVVKPYDSKELAFRIKRILHLNGRKETSEYITCGDLVIDLAKCEVTLSNKVIVLTFMEYELLKFLAGNKGRVMTREVLLNNVWGYDYYGGDRTVDVHIRRLRSKIEDSEHTFIETVRNIGYRFREDN